MNTKEENIKSLETGSIYLTIKKKKQTIEIAVFLQLVQNVNKDNNHYVVQVRSTTNVTIAYHNKQKKFLKR